MKKRLILLLICTLASTCFALTKKETNQDKSFYVLGLISPGLVYPKAGDHVLKEIEDLLRASSLNTVVINKVIKTLQCSNRYHVDHNNILTVIDYSLPSSEKRLWVFDLSDKKLLFNTYVSHGIKSGALLSTFFSNKYNSKSSSIGVYTTEKIYYGRDGLSLRLDGLDKGFNDNASNRSVVMHGGWYVDEDFIKKYGRAGRSWGCPALPQNLTAPIIHTIKDQSLFVIYYPSDNWFLKSKFLNCDKLSPIRDVGLLETEIKPSANEGDFREPVLFANVKSEKAAETGPILVMTADNYQRIFQTKPPLERMLRRQINKVEYIALSSVEFEKMAINDPNDSSNAIFFVVPIIKMVRGYYATEMHIVNLGKIKEIRLNTAISKNFGETKSYAIDFEKNTSISLRATNQFIRWLGL